MASPTQWTWVWVNSGSWWWTGRPGMLRFMGLRKVRHDWATKLNWTEFRYKEVQGLGSWNQFPKRSNYPKPASPVSLEHEVPRSPPWAPFRACWYTTAQQHRIQSERDCRKRQCQSLSLVWLFATPWTVACQAPLSKGFSRQYWSGLPYSSPRDLPNPGIEPRSPALQADSLPSEPPGKSTEADANALGKHQFVVDKR